MDHESTHGGREKAGRPGWRRAGPLRAVVLACCFVALLYPLRGAPDTGGLEALVRQWLDLRAEIGTVEHAWQEQKTLLEDELALLQLQKEQLEKALAEERESAEAAAGAAAEAAAERDRNQALLDAWKPALVAAESHLLAWEALLPPFMRPGLAGAFRQMAATGEKNAPAEAAQRLHEAFNLYSQLEQLNGGIYADKVILEDAAGKEREMDVLFFGLACGYAVSPDDSAAATGRVTPQGVVWEWDPSLAPQIRHAWACFHKERSAAFVELPLQVGRAQP